jgi:hypothetical protein
VLVRGRFDPIKLGAPGTEVHKVTEELQGIVAPGRPLGTANDITVVVVLIEVWTNRTYLRFGVTRTTLTDKLDAEYAAAMRAYDPRQDPATTHPQDPSAVFFDALPVAVSDDTGLRYFCRQMSTGGPWPWRSEWTLTPGVPRRAKRLTIAVEGADPADRQSLDVQLPGRASD